MVTGDQSQGSVDVRAGRDRAVLLAIVAVVLAAAAVLVWHPRQQSLDDRVSAVSAELRCPTCVAESVAASNTPIAQSMRSEVRAQLTAGRSEEQVLSWFRARYGDDVVLAPTTDRTGLLLWTAPVVALAAGGVVVAVTLRRRNRAPKAGVLGADPAVDPLTRARLLIVGAVVVLVGAAVPVGVSLLGADEAPARAAATAGSGASTADLGGGDWVDVARDLDHQGSYQDAARAWRHALEASPGSAMVRTRLGFDLLRLHRPGTAVRLVRGPARAPGDYRSLAMLVLGLAQRDLGDAAAPRTLRAFLRLDPDHPAAPQVRRLLGSA